MSIELQKMDERPLTPDRTSSISATATAVNSPDKPQFPQNAAEPDADSLCSSLDTISSDSDEDEDEIPSAEGKLPEDAVQGWPQLAQLMADTPDFAAFPRFRDLNVKSLLYYQVELSSLRKKLQKLEHADKAHSERKKYALYADTLVNEANASEQLETVRMIRTVLKEYNKALLQYSQICALPDPEPFNMRTLRKWLRNGECGDFNIRALDEGGAVNTWGPLQNNPDDKEKSLWSQFGNLLWGLVWMRRPAKSMYEPDLALTSPQTEVDGLTHWYASEWKPFSRSFKKRKERKSGNGPNDVEQNVNGNVAENPAGPAAPWAKKAPKEKALVSWSQNSALRLTSGISTVVACLLPVIAISVLSQLQGLKALLLCLAGFSLVFAIGLIALTQGTSKRTEIFGATAAFSAVMVVFISIPPAPVIYMPPGSAIPSVSPSAVISALASG
ncbi:uncharacterized protein N0V89_001494 [Didymosphaeria variabile]|uniref:DUF6594 domain-containing protein n=1 Tax=Didymosphaeria variabile TaxID=1932322 RepID=A0A9W8XY78_9PLEO|nr:uncharacterized protein N0V89_001494 [Didymosphaeria variabile]KAJ4360925.1 hypothetical protein N0V89_001494 [Didymosphaeria variabile]